MKVTVIEEAHDISCLKVDEMIGSLQNFELNIKHKTDIDKLQGTSLLAGILVMYLKAKKVIPI